MVLTMISRDKILFHFIFYFFLVVVTGSAELSFCQEGVRYDNPKRGPSFDLSGKNLEFNVLEPGRSSYIIENIEINHDGKRAATIRVRIMGIRHDETNAALDPEKWLKITPSEGSASSDNPFLFNMEAHLPKEMPGVVPDGLYVGRLKIESEDAATPVYIPFRFTLNLPDFSIIPEELTENGLTVPFSCCIPGSREISFAMTSDAMADLPVKIIAPVNIKNEQGASIQSSHLNVVMASSGSIASEEEIAGAGKKHSNIALKVNVKNPALASGRYEGMISIRGDYGRSMYIPLHIIIPEAGTFWIDKYRYFFAVGSVVMIVLLFIRPLRLLVIRRKRFERNVLRVDKSGKIPATWNQYLSAVYSGTSEQDRWTLTTIGRGKSISLKTTDILSATPGTSADVSGACVLSLQSRVNHTYELSVSSVTRFGIQMRVTRSPYRSGRVFGEGLVYILALVLCAGSAYFPQFWCRMFPFL
jgi:hypothetical protein